jgi:cell division protein FtsB
MKGTKLLLSFWLSTVTFCLLQIIFGPTGLTETARLKEFGSRLDSRLEALQEDNIRLSGRYEALRTSADAVRLEARALGYFRPGETPVRTPEGVVFRLPSDAPDLSPVKPLPVESPGITLFFRLAWPLLFLVFFSFFHLWERLWPRGTPEDEQPFRQVMRLPAPIQTGLDFFRK